MILGLTALGEGRMPLRTRIEMSTGHTVGGMVGGTAASAILWLAFTPIRTLFPDAVSAVSVATTAVVAILVDTRLLRTRSHGSQVPPVWLARHGPTRSYAMYGFMLGSGFATARPYAVIYAVFLALALLSPFPQALMGGALFGLGRTALIGPASFRATAISLLLYRSPRSRRVWSTVSVMLSAALVLLVAVSAGAS